MTRAEKKEELIGLFAVGAIYLGDLIDECFEFADEHPVSDLENTEGASLDEIFGDPEQDLDDIINELFGKTEQLKND